MEWCYKDLSIHIDNKNDDIKKIAPSIKEDYCCSQYRLNHEARDFIREVLLYMIDEFEQSKEFSEILKENKFLTNDAYDNVVKKLKDFK